MFEEYLVVFCLLYSRYLVGTNICCICFVYQKCACLYQVDYWAFARKRYTGGV